MSITLHISREGENLFVDGLHKSYGTTHVVPGLQPQDLMVEPGGRAYLQVGTLPGSRSSRAVRASLHRASDGAELCAEVFESGSGTLTYDPWGHI